MSSERVDPRSTLPMAPGGIAQQRMRVAGRMFGSLLLGGVATLGSIVLFRQGLLPLIDAVFQPGPEWLSAFRRTGIILAAVAGYWAYVHWYEKREATELRLQPVRLMLGGASGAALVALPIAMLFAFGAYELLLFRGASPALLGVAALIGIAATLEELVYRCLLFRLLERAWGTCVALVVQAVVFAVAHLGNVEQGGNGDCADTVDRRTERTLQLVGISFRVSLNPQQGKSIFAPAVAERDLRDELGDFDEALEGSLNLILWGQDLLESGLHRRHVDDDRQLLVIL